MDPKGILEMLLMFLDGKGNDVLFHPSHESNSVSNEHYKCSTDGEEAVFVF
jgi:hypothetical protein